MPRTFDVSTESTASVDQILEAFGDREYWRARLALFTGGSASLDSLNTSPSGEVTVRLRIGMLRDRLPKVVTQLRRGDLEMVRNETWTPTGDGRAIADISVTVPGAPLSAAGQAVLEPQGDGSRLTYTATVAVKVPVVGGKIEHIIGEQTLDEISRLQRFTTEWITESR
jgi:hypothetical protein